MEKRILIFYFSILIAILSGCKEQTVNKKKDIEALNSFFTSYVHYIQTDNLDSLMMLWEDDAKRISPDVPTIIGKENIRTDFKNLMEYMNIQMFPYGEREMEVCENLAYVYYTVSVIMTPKVGAPPQNTDIKGLTIFNRQKDGSWKAYMDCMNYHPTVAIATLDSLEMEEPSVYY